MSKLIILIFISVILLIISIAFLIIALVKSEKKLYITAFISILISAAFGMYAMYFGLKKGKEKSELIANNIVEKAFPTFDSDKPDTEANKRNFKNFLNVDISPDVKNIYCLDDAIGQDADYMFSFNCDSITVQKIIETHSLTKDSIIGNYSESMQSDIFWWDKNVLNKLPSYSWDSKNKGKNQHKVLWYDDKNKKAYYFDYDL